MMSQALLVTGASPPAHAISRLFRNLFGQTQCDHALSDIQRVRELAVKYSVNRALKWQTQNQCFSCHTVLPAVLSAGNSVNPEILSSVERRLANFDQAPVWYPEQEKASRSTELIMSLLTQTQAGQTPKPEFFQKLMSLQEEDGAWAWLDYDLHPWESDRGRVYGATLASIALVRAGAIDNPAYAPMVSKIRSFLKSIAEDSNSFIWQKTATLWAEAEGVGALSSSKAAQIATEIMGLQHRDGGWSMNALGTWTKKGRRASSPGDKSDGYASAFNLYVIKRWMASSSFAGQSSGVKDQAKSVMNQGISWLLRNQKTSGTWESSSVNRDNAFNHGLIEDAAAGFGAMVLGD